MRRFFRRNHRGHPIGKVEYAIEWVRNSSLRHTKHGLAMGSTRIFDTVQHGYIDPTAHQFHAADIEIIQFQVYFFEDLDRESPEGRSR
jgi:hypothetical protein